MGGRQALFARLLRKLRLICGNGILISKKGEGGEIHRCISPPTLFSMNRYVMARRLYDEFARQIRVNLPAPDIDNKRLEAHFTSDRGFIGVLDKHILGNTQTVVFTMEAVNNSYLLRFFLPLYGREYKKLLASRYTPVLRSKHYLTVGTGEQRGLRYAYCAVKLPPHRGAFSLINALEQLGKELEKFLAYANMGVL